MISFADLCFTVCSNDSNSAFLIFICYDLNISATHGRTRRTTEETATIKICRRTTKMNTQHSEHARADELILLLKVDISF